MNRLIIAGNGFDLSHGMATRYNDFLNWYLKRAHQVALKNGEYSDDILHLENEERYQPRHSKEFEDSDGMIDFFWKETQILKMLRNKEFKVKENHYNYFYNPFTTKYLSPLLSDLLQKTGPLRWVDIEQAYYHSLTWTLADPKSTSGSKEMLVSQINEHLTCLTQQLCKYLETLPKSEFNPQIAKKLIEEIKLDDILEKSDLRKKMMLTTRSDLAEAPEGITILNFNFTETATLYKQIIKSKFDKPLKLDVINIHGQLNNQDTHPVVFGFGDELDVNYKLMEDSEIKGFFKHAKSFAYFKNNEYSKLVRFIDEKEFQVFICGHSCGLSDRTLLNMIFEHDNCRSIKIFFHQFEDGSDTYRETSEEISRHFKNKIKMRNRLVNKSKSQPLLA